MIIYFDTAVNSEPDLSIWKKLFAKKNQKPLKITVEGAKIGAQSKLRSYKRRVSGVGFERSEQFIVNG